MFFNKLIFIIVFIIFIVVTGCNRIKEQYVAANCYSQSTIGMRYDFKRYKERAMIHKATTKNTVYVWDYLYVTVRNSDSIIVAIYNDAN